MTEWSWAKVRIEAIKAFDDELPNAQTEQDILDCFEEAPSAVVAAMRQVAEDKRAGRVRSGWAIWRMRAKGVHGKEDRIVSDTSERDSRVRTAERWLVNVGHEFDREEEILDELFGPTGRLRDYADDESLRQRLVERWAARSAA